MKIFFSQPAKTSRHCRKDQCFQMRLVGLCPFIGRYLTFQKNFSTFPFLLFYGFSGQSAGTVEQAASGQTMQVGSPKCKGKSSFVVLISDITKARIAPAASSTYTSPTPSTSTHSYPYPQPHLTLKLILMIMKNSRARREQFSWLELQLRLSGMYLPTEKLFDILKLKTVLSYQKSLGKITM